MKIAAFDSMLSFPGLGRARARLSLVLHAGIVLALGLISVLPLLVFPAKAAWAQEDVQVTIIPRAGTLAMLAQQQPQAPPAAPSPQAGEKILLPPGTRLALGLTRPLQIRSKQAQGSVVYMQVTFPVTVDNRMVVPPGAYVQGVIEKMTFNRGANPDLAFEMRSADLIYPNGYTVPITGAVHLEHRTSMLDPPPTPGEREQIKNALLPNAMNRPPVVMSAAAVTPPTLPPLPSMGNGPRNAIIAVGVISAAAVVGLSIYAATRHSNDIYLEAGTPLEIVLPAELVVDAQSAGITGPLNAGVAQPNPAQPGQTGTTQPPAQQPTTAPPAPTPQPPIVQPPKKPQMCYTPGTPGTPDTVIPGTPGTPAVGDIPGTPGTPDTVIPGTPATPGYWHTCGK